MRARTNNFIAITWIVVLLGFLWIFVVMNQPTEKASTTTAEDSSPDLSDLVQNKKFQADNPGYLNAVRELIEDNGYACANLTMLHLKGQSPYGSKLEALCGPDDGTGNTYASQHYAVYPDKLKVNLCEEFGFMPKDCS